MRLAEYLEATGQKPKQIADAVGVAEHSVRRWLRGDRTPDAPTMRVIYAVTKGLVTPKDFVLVRP